MVSIKTPENYLLKAGVINMIGDYVSPLASRVLFITGRNALRTAGEGFRQIAFSCSVKKVDSCFFNAYIEG